LVSASPWSCARPEPCERCFHFMCRDTFDAALQFVAIV
jgi:hypothetical protein